MSVSTEAESSKVFEEEILASEEVSEDEDTPALAVDSKQVQESVAEIVSAQSATVDSSGQNMTSSAVVVPV